MPDFTMSRRQWIGAALALPLATPACLSAATAPDATALDLMPAFWRVYDSGRALPIAERAARLHRGFFEPHQATYRLAGQTPPTEAALAHWLPRFDPIAAEARSIHRRFALELNRHSAAFRQALPDFDPRRSPIYLLPSLGAFDAHLEPHPDGLPLFFAPDGIARYHGPGADLSVLFTHEIYHCYQGQLNPDMAQDAQPSVYVNLWVEGGATYASEQLNPHASLYHVLLDDDALLRDGPGSAARVAAALLDRLDASDEATLDSFFTTSSHGDWPARMGYYVGLLVAREWGRTMDLHGIATMPRQQVRALGITALQVIAGRG